MQSDGRTSASDGRQRDQLRDVKKFITRDDATPEESMDAGPQCQRIVSEKFQLDQSPVTNRRRQLGRSIISKTIPSPVTIRRRQLGRYIITMTKASKSPVGTTMCPSIRNSDVLWLPFYAKKDYDLSRRGTTNDATIRCPAETLIPLMFYPNYRLCVSLVLM